MACAIMYVELAETLTVCDVKSSLAAAFAEELKQITMNKGLTVEITACERDEEVDEADLALNPLSSQAIEFIL